MPKHTLEFEMPASASVVFDVFHYHAWRSRWDSLVGRAGVVGGAPCPFVGAETDNEGAGILRLLSMRTRFVAFKRPQVAAATMVGQSFPFTTWSASMRHREIDDARSVIIYTYNFQVGPRSLHWLLEPIVRRAFVAQTCKRFHRMREFLIAHAQDVVDWQGREGLQ